MKRDRHAFSAHRIIQWRCDFSGAYEGFLTEELHAQELEFKVIEQILEKARTAGELPAEADVRVLSTSIGLLFLGILRIGLVHIGPSTVQEHAREALEHWFDAVI